MQNSIFYRMELFSKKFIERISHKLPNTMFFRPFLTCSTKIFAPRLVPPLKLNDPDAELNFLANEATLKKIHRGNTPQISKYRIPPSFSNYSSPTSASRLVPPRKVSVPRGKFNFLSNDAIFKEIRRENLE